MFNQKVAFIIYYYVFVTISFFNAPFLIGKGISPEQVGYGFSFSVLIALLLMLLSGYLNDQKIITNQRMIQILLVITGVFYFGIYFGNKESIVITSYVILTAAFLSIPSIIDSLIIHSIEETNYSYANIRKYGSIGAATSYFLAAFMMSTVDFKVVLIMNVVLIGLLCFFVNRVKYNYVPERKDYFTGLRELRKKTEVWTILIIAFLTYGVIRADDPYTITYNAEIVKLSGLTVGIIGFCSILFEAYIISLYDKIVNKIGERKLMSIAICALILIFITKYTNYDSKVIISTGNILLGLFIGLFVPIAINLLDRNSNIHVKTTVFSFYQFAIYFGGFVLGMLTTYTYVQTNFLPNIYILHAIVVSLALIFTRFLKVKK
ncbi:MAG: MFS transporter [Mycoplasmatales bacterium]